MIAAHGWRLWPDDSEQRIQEAEEIASRDLSAFEWAGKNNDGASMTRLMRTQLLAAVEEAYHNNEGFLPRFAWIIETIHSLAYGDLNSWIRAGTLGFLVRAIDKNRDNLSYYRLDAGRMWIDRRINSTKGSLKSDLLDIQNRIIDTRDTLDSMAQVFVQNNRKLIANTWTPCEAPKNTDSIKAAADDIMQKYENSKDLIPKYQATIERIKETIAKYARKYKLEDYI